MGFLAVIVATIAAFAFGAGWYGFLAKPWMADSGVPVGEDGKPQNAASPVPYVTCFIAQIFVAGMLRLLLENVGVTGIGNAIQWGAAVGLFFITPWLALTNGYTMRPLRLTAIDGGYATIGCAIMAGVLFWLAPGL